MYGKYHPILCNTECAMGLEPEAHAVRIHVPYIVGNAFMATVPSILISKS